MGNNQKVGLFERLIYFSLSSKIIKFLIIILTIVAFFASLTMLTSETVLARMLPGKSANTYSIYIDTPTGSSMYQTKKVTSCVLNILRQENEILNMEAFYGQGIPLDYAGLVKGASMKQTENVAEIAINLTDKHNRVEPSFLMTQRLRPIIAKRCANVIPGTSIKLIEQPSGPPTLASIVLEVHGDNIEQSRKLSVEVSKILANTKGLVDVDIMADEIFEKFNLIPDAEKISRSGLSMKQVNNILYLAFEGMVIATKNSKHHSSQIPIFLVLSKETSQLQNGSIDALKSKLSSLNLMNMKGMMVPLSEVVEITKVKSTP
ncbi:MAG: efflux RND transporter permease subunit, partial [Sulfurovaceae bacterium]|nr:efflux RND transporter permease subunit [Sulfurovaceae bacterium]